MVERKHQDAAHAHRDPDPELALSGIVWSAVGIVGVTAVAMVLMVWLSGALVSRIESGEAPLTPAEVQAAEAVRLAGEERLEGGELPVGQGLSLPADFALPPGPQLETTLTGEIDRLRAREAAVLDHWGWADEAAATVHVPIDQAIDLAVAGTLPSAAAESFVETGAATGEDLEVSGEDEVQDAV